MKDVNSNSFEFNSNGFELGLDKKEGPKMFGFLMELRKMAKELLARLESQNMKKKKAKGFNMQVGSWVIPKQWNFFNIAP